MDAAEGAEGFLGAGSLRLSPEDPPPSDDEGVTLDYPSGVTIEGLRVVCFGAGVTNFSFATRTGASWAGSESIEVECDGTERAVELRGPIEGVNAVRLNGALMDGLGAIVAASVSGISG